MSDDVPSEYMCTQRVQMYLLFDEFFLGGLYVSHAEVLEDGKFHRIWSVVKLLNVDQPKLPVQTEYPHDVSTNRPDMTSS